MQRDNTTVRQRYECEGHTFQEVPPSPSFELSISGLEPHMDENYLKGLFHGCENAAVLKNGAGFPSGIALLKFTDDKGLLEAVERSKSMNGVVMTSLLSAKSVVLFYNTENRLNSPDYMELFAPCGRIMYIQLKSMKEYGLVSFSSAEEAERALQLDGLAIDGLPLRLCIPGKSSNAGVAIDLLGKGILHMNNDVGGLLGGPLQRNTGPSKQQIGGGGLFGSQSGGFGGNLNQNKSAQGGGLFGNKVAPKEPEGSVRSKSELIGCDFQKVPPSSSFEVIIRGLELNMDEDNIKGLFRGCENAIVLRNKSGESRGIALLTFANEESLREAVEHSKAIQNIEMTTSGNSRSLVLFYNIGDQLDSTDYRNIFKPCGGIMYIQLRPGQGHGFINFTNDDEAERALQLDGLVVDGLPLRICIPGKSPNATTALRLLGHPIFGGGAGNVNNSGGGLFGGPTQKNTGLGQQTVGGGGNVFGSQFKGSGGNLNQIKPGLGVHLPRSPSFEVILKGLHSATNENDLKRLFPGCEHAFVLTNELGESRGVALLKFIDVESLKYAVEYAKSMYGVGMEAAGAHKSVVLFYNTPNTFTQVNQGHRLLHNTFGPCGQIRSTTYRDGLGFGFVSFLREEDAEEALDLEGLIVAGQPLRVCIPGKSPIASEAVRLVKNTFGGLFGASAKSNPPTFANSAGGSGGFGGPKFGSFDTNFAVQTEGLMQQQKSIIKEPASKANAQSLLERMFVSKKFADLTFDVQGETILAHKGVLSERSQYFADLFSGEETSQPKMTKITISDVNPVTFNAFLEYIYCEEVKSDEDLAIELLKLSEKYAIPDLKLKCEYILGSLLTAKNFSKLANVAEEYKSDGLRESLLSFIAKNGMGTIGKEQMNDIPQSLLVDMVQRLSRK